MKRINLKSSLFALLTFMMMVMLSGDTYAQQSNIAYVDSEIIIRQLPEYQSITNELEGLQRQYVDTIQMVENELKAKAETFKNEYEAAQQRVESSNITEQEFNELNQRLGYLQQELQQLDQDLVLYRQQVQQIVLQRQAELFQPVRERVTRAIEDTAKDMKISFVFDKADGNLIYGDKQFDITFRVLDKLK